MDQDSAADRNENSQGSPERRPFMIGFLAGLIGMGVGVVPLVSGVVSFLNPLRRREEETGAIRVATLDAVPADGLPYRFSVIAEREDAWTKYPRAPIGSVYLMRQQGDTKPKAFSAVCPHLGCMVDFKRTDDRYQCPCHNSKWTVDGARIDPQHCPSPRDLDELEVEVKNGDEVFVVYKKFRSGIAKKIEE